MIENQHREFALEGQSSEYYKKYISYLVLSLTLTTIGTFCGNYIVPYLNKQLFIAFSIISLVLLGAFVFTKGKLKKVLFYAFTFGEGITLAPMISIFTTVSIYKCLIATTLIVLSFCILGFKFKDLSFLRSILFALLLSTLGLTILSIFVHLPFLSYLGLGVFCLYLMYDINAFKLSINQNLYLDDDFIINSVMNVYLDIINILIYVLRIVSNNDD